MNTTMDADTFFAVGIAFIGSLVTVGVLIIRRGGAGVPQLHRAP